MRRTQLILLLVLGAVTPVFADAPTKPIGPATATGQSRLASGDVAYQAGDFARAATEYAAGYAAEGWSGFLFAQAQAQRQRGECPNALELYNRFLATAPPPKAEQMARDGIAACGGSSSGTASQVSPLAHPDDTSLEKIELRPPPPRDTPFPHTLAVILVGSGLAVGATGVVFAVRANSDADAAKRQDTLPETTELYERAKDRTLIARISFGVGAALVVSGVVRFVLHRPPRESSTEIVLVPGGLGVAGRF